MFSHQSYKTAKKYVNFSDIKFFLYVIDTVKKVLVYALWVCLIGVYGCSESDVCSGERNRVDTLDDFDCENSTTTSIILTSTEFILVRRQEDFEAMVKTLCSPSIDWSKYDLIAGNLDVENSVLTITPFVSFDCATNTVQLDIEILTSTVLDPADIAFTAIIPKLENDEELFVNFE